MTTLARSTPTRPRVVEALARRWPTGVGVASTGASAALLAPLPGLLQVSITAWCLLLAAVIYLTWGTTRGALADHRLLTAQTAGVLGFGAVAVAALAVDPALARYVLAAGWLGHAAWDAVHHRSPALAGRVVPRWYGEACLVADLVAAAALLTLGTH